MVDDLLLISPLLIVTVMGLVSLLVGVFAPAGSFKGWLAFLTSFGFLAALGACYMLWHETSAGAAFSSQSFHYSLTLDHFGLALCGVILLGALLATLTAVHYLPAQKSDHAEYYALIAFSALGMMIMVMAADLLTLFVALEVMSISIYILAGFKRDSSFSTESAMKYFILGSFASAILLLGISFTYGATGTISMREIGLAVAGGDAHSELALFGMVMLIVAFGFKIAAAPFHMWTPDVYEGAPASVTGFMAVGVKAAGFGALARLLLTCFGAPEYRDGSAVSWETLIVILAVISMCAGNLMALAQKNLKRMLAYSAIAHTGYLLMALLVVPASSDGEQALNALGGGLVFYLLAYTLANVAAFGVAAAVGARGVEDAGEEAYAGLAGRDPMLAFALTIAMLSLLGIPLTAGFMGKLTLFGELLSSGGGEYLWLVVVAVVNSVVSAYYYLRVVMVAYMQDESAEKPIALLKSGPLRVAVGVAAILTLVFGIMPNKAINASTRAGYSLVHTSNPATYGARVSAAKPAITSTVEPKDVAHR